MTKVGISPAPATRRDRLKQLRAFCEAARHGSISRAAEHILSSQPVVSTQVRALEQELGVPLFERRGPRLILTRVGENLYRVAMPLVQKLLRLPGFFAEQYHGVEPGRLCMGAGEVSAAYLLPGPLKRFRARHPGVRIEVRTGTGRARLDWLRSFEIDLMVAAFDSVPSDIEFHPFRRSEVVVATPEGHPLANRGFVTLESVAPYPLVAPVSGHYARQVQDVVLRLHGVSPRVVLEVEGWGAILNHVAAGSGIAFVPDVSIMQSERVRMIPVRPRPVHRVYGVAMRRDGLVTPAAGRLVRSLVSEPIDTGEVP